MSLFDCVVAVDWSAANARAKGKDSIWVAAGWREEAGHATLCENIPTRMEAVAFLEDLFRKGLERGHRVLAGFDFAFGYPEAQSARVCGAEGWEGLWAYLASEVEDHEDNRSNRFDVAGRMNRRAGEALFWGKPHQHKDRYPNVPAKRPGDADPRRLVEERVPSAKSVFQLAYNGAVGSQTILGIAHLERMRRRLGAKVWPFETDFAEDLPRAPSLVFAEIYPSLILSSAPDGEVKDKAQVQAFVKELLKRNREGSLAELLSPPEGTSAEEREAMVKTEGSILGAGVL
ncbi:hypothetical protein HK107_04290 [Parvularcula sp. ZS-1/3]|uniref:Cobalamin biosynthesis protein CbiG n=1 Tax=Parvularcula mediterranea TaxID=2732508 RepID=A0A7Y3RL56_9PROT|nr:hypothetical protein [Parvularcula mediterranea]NNU15536.1 hypothetical protein [Parvularcula mediterranea]